MRKILLILFVISVSLKGQSQGDKWGFVSYTGSENVYVKFNSTEGIRIGDTLYIEKDGRIIPALKVEGISSTSALCTLLKEIELKVSDPVVAKIITDKDRKDSGAPGLVSSIPAERIEIYSDTGKTDPDRIQRITGSISASSYSDFSGQADHTIQRFRYSISLNAKNIGNSRFSAESYISFRHKKGEWEAVRNNMYSALKIYNLSLQYDAGRNTRVIFGRYINPRVSNMGAMDGLQLEKSIRRFTLGAMAGSRPDFNNYGFDPSLFQYGAYIAFKNRNEKNPLETSLALVHQTNHFKTDREFLYVQNSYSITRNISFFGTCELDLFKPASGTTGSAPALTGLFLSIRHQVNSRISLTGSYDARRNVMYYETFKSGLDTLLEKEMRQGLRIMGTYRISKNLIFGIQPGYRYLKSDAEPTKNLYTYLNYSRIPGIDVSANISSSFLETAYLKGTISGVSLSKDIAQGRIQTGLGYRYADYSVKENAINIHQHIAEGDLSILFKNKITLSLNYEASFGNPDKDSRVYLQLRKRF